MVANCWCILVIPVVSASAPVVSGSTKYWYTYVGVPGPWYLVLRTECGFAAILCTHEFMFLPARGEYRYRTYVQTISSGFAWRECFLLYVYTSWPPIYSTPDHFLLPFLLSYHLSLHHGHRSAEIVYITTQ